MIMKKIVSIFCLFFLFVSAYAHASLMLDRTRVIYDAGQAGVSVVVENTDPKDPYLAQVWLESADGQRITEPLVALPLLQRIDPNQRKQIRISMLTNATTQLAQDRETLFYFNLLGVPPKSQVENAVEIVIQSRFKLFYRPQGLKVYPDANWQRELTIERTGNELVLNNPTSYYIIIININHNRDKVENFSELILAPYSTTIYPISEQLGSASTIVVTYIDDYGAAQLLEYRCVDQSCVLNSQP